MMHGLGHEVFLYAGPESEAQVTEHIPCLTEEERAAIHGDDHFVMSSFDYSLPSWKKFNATVADRIKERMQTDLPQILCLIGGLAHKQIADSLPDMLCCEFSIGYSGSFAPFRVFESSEWMHTIYAHQGNCDPTALDGRWFDDVIPGSFSPDDFPFRAEKEDFLLFVGRLIERKGLGIAVDVAKRLGKKLVVAGQGNPPTDAHVEYVGIIGPEQRGDLMSRAHALLCPTVYIGPFENVAVEAQLCGTPAIGTDWGAYRSTIEDGVTGFRCRTMHEFLRAVERAPELDPHYIRDRAVRLYSTEAVAKLYQRYFDRLGQLFSQEGWYWLPPS